MNSVWRRRCGQPTWTASTSAVLCTRRCILKRRCCDLSGGPSVSPKRDITRKEMAGREHRPRIRLRRSLSRKWATNRKQRGKHAGADTLENWSGSHRHDAVWSIVSHNSSYQSNSGKKLVFAIERHLPDNSWRHICAAAVWGKRPKELSRQKLLWCTCVGHCRRCRCMRPQWHASRTRCGAERCNHGTASRCLVQI